MLYSNVDSDAYLQLIHVRYTPKVEGLGDVFDILDGRNPAPVEKHSGNRSHSWLENGPGLKMYFLLKMGIFQPAMLVYQRVDNTSENLAKRGIFAISTGSGFLSSTVSMSFNLCGDISSWAMWP